MFLRSRARSREKACKITTNFSYTQTFLRKIFKKNAFCMVY